MPSTSPTVRCCRHRKSTRPTGCGPTHTCSSGGGSLHSANTNYRADSSCSRSPGSAVPLTLCGFYAILSHGLHRFAVDETVQCPVIGRAGGASRQASTAERAAVARQPRRYRPCRRLRPREFVGVRWPKRTLVGVGVAQTRTNHALKATEHLRPRTQAQQRSLLGLAAVFLLAPALSWSNTPPDPRPYRGHRWVGPHRSAPFFL